MPVLATAGVTLHLLIAAQSVTPDLSAWSVAENEIRACVEDGNWSCRSSALAVCMGELDRPTHYWATCLDRERQVWDDLLNEAYRNLVRRIRDAPENDLPEDYPDTRIEQLRDAQRAWITLRDLNCEYEADRSLGGTHIMTTIPECLTRETAERLRWLIEHGARISLPETVEANNRLAIIRGAPGCERCTYLQIRGEITSNMGEELSRLLLQNPDVRAIRINSPGGNLFASLEIGTFIRENGIHVAVSDQDVASASCLSACVFILSGGVSRAVHPNARVGVHQFYGLSVDQPASEVLDASQRVSGLLVLYLSEMGIDNRLLAYASLYGPDEIGWINHDELESVGLVNIRYGEVILETMSPEQANAAVLLDPFGEADLMPLPRTPNECMQPFVGRLDQFSRGVSTSSPRDVIVRANRLYRALCEAYFRSQRPGRQMTEGRMAEQRRFFHQQMQVINDEAVFEPLMELAAINMSLR